MDRHARTSGRLESAAFATGPQDRPVQHTAASHPEVGFFALAYGMEGKDPQTGALGARLVANDLAAQAVLAGGFADSDALAAAVHQSELRLRRHLQEVALTDRICTVTLAALQVRETKAIVAHVGNLRVYRLHRGHDAPLTRDHTLERVVQEGDGWLEPDERRDLKTHERARWEGAPFRNVVCRGLVSLPANHHARTTPVETTVHDAAAGDLFLLAPPAVGDEWHRAPGLDAGADLPHLPQALARRVLAGLPQEVTPPPPVNGGAAHLRPFVPQLAAIVVHLRE